MKQTRTVMEHCLHPWVTFRICDEDYSINSENVIQIIPNDEQRVVIPHAPQYYAGIMDVRGESFPVVDMRLLLDQQSRQDALRDFAAMKEKHVGWVKELERCAQSGDVFTLPRDPHKCMFGIWYDGYHTDVMAIQYILKQIDKPHKELHAQADIMEKCRESNDMAGMEAALDRAKSLCHKVIVPLLDKLIDEYSNSTRGIIILLQSGERKLGLLVDSISAVRSFEGCVMEQVSVGMEHGSYFAGLIYSADDKMYLDFDVERVFRLDVPLGESVEEMAGNA